MDRHVRPDQQLQALIRREALSRRDFLRVAASAGAVGAGVVLLGGCGSSDGDRAGTADTIGDAPPETTTIRLPKDVLELQLAPLYLAEQFLSEEGFTDVQYIDVPPFGAYQELRAGEVDIGLEFAPGVLAAVDRGDQQIALLAGVQRNAFQLFGNDRVQSLRDLKGKRIFVFREDANDFLYALWALLLGYVGFDLEHDVEFVALSPNDLFPAIQAGTIDAWLSQAPFTTLFHAATSGHVFLDGLTDPPWSQHFGRMATGNKGFVEKHPAATKRALRAILKASDVCAREPERAAHYLVDRGFTTWLYDQTLDGIHAQTYTAWREFDPEDTVRFNALRLRDAGLVKRNPDELIARATDWRYLEEIKRELAVA